MESLLTGPLAGPLAGHLGKLARQRTAPLILELDLTDGVIEIRPPDPLSAVMRRHQPTIIALLAGLKTPSPDDRAKALAVKPRGQPTGLGGGQERRGQARRFRAGGRPPV